MSVRLVRKIQSSGSSVKTTPLNTNCISALFINLSHKSASGYLNFSYCSTLHGFAPIEKQTDAAVLQSAHMIWSAATLSLSSACACWNSCSIASFSPSRSACSDSSSSRCRRANCSSRALRQQDQSSADETNCSSQCTAVCTPFALDSVFQSSSTSLHAQGCTKCCLFVTQ